MRIKMGLIFVVIFFTMFPMAVSFGTENEILQSPSAFFPATSYEFEPVVDGTKVLHDFIVQNRGTVPLKIEKVKTS